MTTPTPGFLGTPSQRRQAAAIFSISATITAGFGIVTTLLAGRPPALQLAGAALGLTYVWLLRKQNVLAWPVGIAGVILAGLVFTRLGLMGQAWLHLYYFLPINTWGWYHWVRGGQDHSTLGISWTRWQEWLVYVPFVVIGTYLVGMFFDRTHDRAVYVFWDANIVVVSVVAQWLVTRKKIENWMLWIGPINVSGIALYWVTGAYMFAVLYALYLVNASVAVYEWISAWKARRSGLGGSATAV